MRRLRAEEFEERNSAASLIVTHRVAMDALVSGVVVFTDRGTPTATTSERQGTLRLRAKASRLLKDLVTHACHFADASVLFTLHSQYR